MLINILFGILKFFGIAMLFDLIVLNVIASVKYDAKTLFSELNLEAPKWKKALGFMLFSLAFAIFGIEKITVKLLELRHQEYERLKKIL